MDDTETFIFGMVAHQVKFEHQGHWTMVRVTQWKMAVLQLDQHQPLSYQSHKLGQGYYKVKAISSSFQGQLVII